jgi:hypothetical protein
MAHAWKACWGQPLAGSNPASSALLTRHDVRAGARAGAGHLLLVSDSVLAPTVLAPTTVPPLTTVRQDAEAMGQRAAEMLLEQLRGGPAPAGGEIMPTSLVVRASA